MEVLQSKFDQPPDQLPVALFTAQAQLLRELQRNMLPQRHLFPSRTLQGDRRNREIDIQAIMLLVFEWLLEI